MDRAVALEAEDELPLVVRSECLNRLDRPSEALKDAIKAIEMNSDNTRLMNRNKMFQFHDLLSGLLYAKQLPCITWGSLKPA